jgi:hypothetical protein
VLEDRSVPAIAGFHIKDETENDSIASIAIVKHGGFTYITQTDRLKP